MKKGYHAELKAKKELQELYGKDNIIKIAIGSLGADFLVITLGELLKVIEVKTTSKKKYSLDKRTREQIKRIIKFAQSQGVPAELWLYYKKKNSRIKVKKTYYLYHPVTHYVKDKKMQQRVLESELELNLNKDKKNEN
jgi:Holliday junction resolvase